MDLGSPLLQTSNQPKVEVCNEEPQNKIMISCRFLINPHISCRFSIKGTRGGNASET